MQPSIKAVESRYQKFRAYHKYADSLRTLPPEVPLNAKSTGQLIAAAAQAESNRLANRKAFADCGEHIRKTYAAIAGDCMDLFNTARGYSAAVAYVRGVSKHLPSDLLSDEMVRSCTYLADAYAKGDDDTRSEIAKALSSMLDASTAAKEKAGEISSHLKKLRSSLNIAKHQAQTDYFAMQCERAEKAGINDRDLRVNYAKYERRVRTLKSVYKNQYLRG